jgi:2-dehydro-3-deoxygluconokinase
MVMKIVAFGECMLEFSQTNSNQWQLNYAGDSYNTAVYLSRLINDAAICYATAVGVDSQSNAMLITFEKEGLDTSLVLRVGDLMPGLYLIENDLDGERQFHYYREQSAAKYYFKHPDWPFLSASWENADCLYLTGISVAILDDESRDALYRLIIKAKNRGALLFFDNNFRQQLWEDKAIAQGVIGQFNELADCLFVTFDDEKTLFGDRCIESTIDRYHKRALCVIKNGKFPCTTIHENKVYTIDISPVKQVVDTTGAGDAFNAGFMSSWLKEQTLDEAILRGHSLASKVIQQKGAILRF